MSVATELQALAGYLTDAYDKCAEKGATMPNSLNMANLTACIDSIQGGGTIIPPEAGTLTSLVVGTLPTKIVYTEGDALDLTGLVVLGNYSNGFQYDVTNNCTYICNDPVTYYDTKIIAELDNITLDIPITVNGIPVQAPLTTIILSHYENNTNNYAPNGTAGTSNGKTYATGKFNLGYSGYALRYTDFTKSKNAFLTGNFTIEYWATTIKNNSNAKFSDIFKLPELIYKTSSTGTESVLGLFSYSTSSGARGYTLNSSISTNNVGYVDLPTTQLQVGESHHIALSVHNGHGKSFVDGVFCGEGDLAWSNLHTVTGIRFAPTGQGYHSIDELMICNESKYTTDFEPAHGPYYVMYTVTFNTDGGSAVASQLVREGNLVTQPADPTKTDYIFGGWYKDSQLTTPWSFSTDTVTTDTTIYAKWEAESPSTVVLTFSNETQYDPIVVTFTDTNSDTEVYTVSSNDTFSITVPNGESLDTTYISADITDDQSEPISVEVYEDGVLEPTQGIDLTYVTYEDKSFYIRDF